jgi:nucleoside-diphosphate-sugar epimerase
MLDENAELCPVTPYGKSKVLAEHDIAALSDGSFCTVSLRNATAYGYSPRLRLDLVINDFCATAHHGGNLLIKSDGTPWRPLVHIDDISSAFIALLKADGATVNGQSYNVGSDDQNYRVSQIAELVAAQIDDCGIEYAAGGGPDKRCYRVSCKKLGRDVPEFVTKWDVGKGARELVDAFELHGLSTSDLTEERFIRLAGLARRQRAGEVDQRLRLVRQTSSQV